MKTIFIQALLKTKQGVLIEQDQRYEKLEYSLNHHGQTVSTYLYPLLREETVVGIIKLSSTKGFTEEDFEFYESFSKSNCCRFDGCY